MSLPDSYLKYPMRRYGMDHDLYSWSPLPQRAPVAWPDGARIDRKSTRLNSSH